MITRHAVEAFIARYRSHFLTLAFICGFVVDALTLNRVDQVFDNIVLLWYVTLSALSLLAMYGAVAGKLPERIGPFVARWAPLVVQFAFGGLFSGILIFYTRSGSLYASWPFLLMIVAMIAGNELIHRRAQRLIFNLSVLFVGLFSYLALVIPVLSGKMGALVFVGSGALAVLLMAGFIKLLHKVVPNFVALNARMAIFSIGLIYAGVNALYFTNVIPPIPLSLKDIGIYRDVQPIEGGGYQLTYEKAPWYFFWRNSEHTYRSLPSDQLFCFASVFAPTRLSTEVYHRWEYFDEAVNQWVEHARISYAIEGGSDRGFRGYTVVSAVREGDWRCTVETARGQVIGREKFNVVMEPPERDIVTRVSN